MCPDEDSFGGNGIHTNLKCLVSYIVLLRGFFYNFLDLVINQSHKGLCVMSLVKILDLSNAGNDMICLFHIHCSIFITAKLGVINNQFLRVLRFLRGLNSKAFFDSQMVSFVDLLNNKDYPQKFHVTRTRGCLSKGKFLVRNFSIWSFPNDFVKSLVSGNFSKPTWSLFIVSLLSATFCSYLCVSSSFWLFPFFGTGFCSLLFPLCFPSLLKLL
jgi:hypothetical protein